GCGGGVGGDAAAEAAGLVAADGAVGQRQRAAVVDAAAAALAHDPVAADGAVGERQLAAVVDAAAGALDVALADGQAVDVHGNARVDLEHPLEVVAADGQQGRAGAVDRRPVRGIREPERAGQPDGAGDVDLDGVVAGVVFGVEDGLAQAAGAGVVQGGDGEGRRDGPVLQRLDRQPGPADGLRLGAGGTEPAGGARQAGDGGAPG